MIALTLTTGIALPLIAALAIVLTPFSDRKARFQIAATYFSYLGTVIYLAQVIA